MSCDLLSVPRSFGTVSRDSRSKSPALVSPLSIFSPELLLMEVPFVEPFTFLPPWVSKLELLTLDTFRELLNALVLTLVEFKVFLVKTYFSFLEATRYFSEPLMTKFFCRLLETWSLSTDDTPLSKVVKLWSGTSLWKPSTVSRDSEIKPGLCSVSWVFLACLKENWSREHHN